MVNVGCEMGILYVKLPPGGIGLVGKEQGFGELKKKKTLHIYHHLHDTNH